MKSLLAAALLTLAFGSSAFGFDSATQTIVDRYKANKLLPITDVAQLMGSSARWCYRQVAGDCGWADIYLDVTDSGATFEISHIWNDSVNIAFTDRGEFKDNRFVCETDFDWVSNLRAFGRHDGTIVLGRELKAIQDEIAANRIRDEIACFDYLYQSADAATQTITLQQRRYSDGAYDAGKDVVVTLHFDVEEAAGLGWY